MIRPCFLVVDREYSGSISTRKLVIETAKFNVLTAYTGAEAIETLTRFPALNGIVLDAGIRDIPAEELIRIFKKINPSVPVIVVRLPSSNSYPEADFQLDSFDPAHLLELLQRMEPEKTRKIEAQNEALSKLDNDVDGFKSS